MKQIPARYKNTAKVLIGLGLLTWLLSRVNFEKVISLFKAGEIHLLITGIGTLLVAFCFFQAIRFHWCIKPISQHFLTSLKLFFLGFLFNNMLPTNVGGDAVRIMYLNKIQNTSLGQSTGLLLIYRLSGLLTLIVGGIVYMFLHLPVITQAIDQILQPALSIGFKTGVLAAILLLVILALLFSPKIRNKATEIFREAGKTHRLFHKTDFIGIIGLAMAFHFSRMVGLYYLVLFFGESIQFIHLIFVLCFTMVIALIPISFGALGLMEGALTGSLLLFDISSAAATGVALINRLVLLIIAAIGGIIYLFGSTTQSKGQKNNSHHLL